MLHPQQREAADELLPQLKEEMDWEDHGELTTEVRDAVLDGILRELQANIKMEDWYGMGFEDPEDFLDAEEVSQAIAQIAQRYFEDDQIGKSHDIFQVIVEAAEREGIAEITSQNE